MIREIVQLSYLIVVANVTLLLFVIFNSTLAAKRKLCFLITGGISLVMVACNILQYSFQGQPSHIPLLYLCNTVSYSISGPVIIPFIYLTSVIRKRTRIVVDTLAGINTVLCIISAFNGCIFSISEEGSVKLGALSPIPFFLSAMYLAILLAASIIKFRFGMRSESLFLFVLTICIVTATVLNTFFGYKYLISGMAVLSTIFYYMFFMAQTLTRDAMTNALNRHSFYKDIIAMKKKQMIVISMDLNWLKQINDTQGHDAGDRAILTVSEAAKELLPMRCRFYRMGGDEFEILCPNMTADEAQMLTEKIKTAVSRKKYSVAIGFAEYQKHMDFEAVLRDADAIMYADKEEMKKIATA